MWIYDISVSVPLLVVTRSDNSILEREEGNYIICPILAYVVSDNLHVTHERLMDG